MPQIEVTTNDRNELIDITDKVRGMLRENDWQDGVLVLHTSHTTTGLTINESADPSVARDIAVNLSRLVPRNGDYRHAEGNSDAHIKSSLVGCSTQVIIDSGQLRLGTWQGIFFCEFDGPRTRKVLAKFLSA